MAFDNSMDFNNKLMELNQWQIEQQRKLKEFQAAQKKLLDADHQTILNKLKLQKADWVAKAFEDCSFNESDYKMIIQKNDDVNCVASKKSSEHDSKSCLRGDETLSGLNCKVDDFSDILERAEPQTKKFLKRGEGLARFRMTMEDFRGIPKIYKDKRIKTYLDKQPKNISKKVKDKKQDRATIPTRAEKKLPFQTNIYAPKQEFKKKSSSSNFDTKPIYKNQDCNKKGFKFEMPEILRKKETLGLLNISAKKIDEDKKEKKNEKKYVLPTALEESTNDAEVIRRKDEKELRLFEFLEQKVNESSFCSSSSIVDKLMEQSIASPPNKKDDKNAEELRKNDEGLCLQPLKENKARNVDKIDNFFELEENDIDTEVRKHSASDCTEPSMGIERAEQDKEEDFEKEVSYVQDLCVSDPNRSDSRDFQNIHKKLLQEYVKNFKNFKSSFNEKRNCISNPHWDTVHSKLEQKNQKPIDPEKIALKLQRKGLQDNVKHLMNWECSARKKSSKRILKKLAPKHSKKESSKLANKEQSEKIILNSTLLRERLDELEKEIAIFRKENSKFEKLHKECLEEKLQLSKEKKDFEKRMQEDREKFEAKVLESQKKLQKEKLVFETYCKQTSNRPNRQEREEINELKREIEKLTSTLSTKEARWGASQARLRNQIRTLEKENLELKSENEKLKKQNARKVTYSGDKSMNAKILRAINFELEKLKPVVSSMRKSCPCSASQSFSARLNKSQEEQPIRRVNSAPNMKKELKSETADCNLSSWDPKVLGSASTDSGIEANGGYKLKNSNSSFYAKRSYSASRKDFDSDSMESVVRQSIFESDEAKNLNMKELKISNVIDQSMSDCKTYKNKIMNSENDRASPVDLFEKNAKFADYEEESELSENDFINKHESNQSTSKKVEGILENQKGGKTFSYYSASNNDRLNGSNIKERVLEDGTKEIFYPNGNIKKIFPDDKVIKIIYYNGDIKETNNEDGSEKYYYSETETWHTTYKDGMEVLEFPTGQTERRYTDGSTEISFPNGCVRYCDSSGKDEWRFLDGTVIKTNEAGHKILLMPNGQKEIHTKEYKRREYPDGTIKILYSDGTQETKYTSGRVRVKDKQGHLLMDSGGV